MHSPKTFGDFDVISRYFRGPCQHTVRLFSGTPRPSALLKYVVVKKEKQHAGDAQHVTVHLGCVAIDIYIHVGTTTVASSIQQIDLEFT